MERACPSYPTSASPRPPPNPFFSHSGPEVCWSERDTISRLTASVRLLYGTRKTHSAMCRPDTSTLIRSYCDNWLLSFGCWGAHFANDVSGTNIISWKDCLTNGCREVKLSFRRRSWWSAPGSVNDCMGINVKTQLADKWITGHTKVRQTNKTVSSLDKSIKARRTRKVCLKQSSEVRSSEMCS